MQQTSDYATEARIQSNLYNPKGKSTMVIHIDVARDNNPDQGQEKRGTFKEPWPLIRIRPNTNVEWQVKNGKARDSFLVTFTNGTPFPNVTAINGSTGPLAATVEGSFHYQVYLTDGDSSEVFPIHRCPELQVAGGDG